jgi:hypothetical protein
MKTAMPMASLKPLRNMAPSCANSTSVTSTSRSCKREGTSGFSITWTAASAAERVIVTNHPVATKPKRHSTSTLPFQKESNLSSIEMEPCPLGLSSATCLYIGSAPKRGRSTIKSVAMGESAPAASAAIPGIYPRVEK